MEGLIKLVAASFARHGIECPAADSQLARPVEPKFAIPLSEPALPTELLEHNFRKSLQADQAP